MPQFGIDGSVYLDPKRLELASQANDKKILRAASHFCARIGHLTENVFTPLGSGFLLFEGKLYIATAEHVIRGRSNLCAQFIDGSTTSLRVVAANEKLDLAIVAGVPEEGKKPYQGPLITMTLTLADVGDIVYVLGFHGTGAALHFTKGAVTSWNRVDDVFTTSITADGDFSGGPVFNLQMDVVGMVAGGHDSHTKQVRFHEAKTLSGYLAALMGTRTIT